MNRKQIRLVQTFVLAAFSLFATFVVLGNLMDYGSNEAFVKHVLSMDTTFEGNKLMWRAITGEGLQTAAYWGIIAAEFAVAALGWTSVVKMVKHQRASSEKYAKAKVLGFYAFLVAILIWFIGFIVLGSEWFAMWQSQIWNGKQTAMDIIEVVGVFLVLFSLPDFALPAKKDSKE